MALDTMKDRETLLVRNTPHLKYTRAGRAGDAPNTSRGGLVHESALRGSPRVAELLLRWRHLCHERNDLGETPLVTYARVMCMHSRLQCTFQIAQRRYRHRDHRCNQCKDYIECFRLLADASGPGGLDAGDERGRTALHHLATYRRPCLLEAARVLVDRGACLNVCDRKGVTPEMVYMKYFGISLKEELRDQGVRDDCLEDSFPGEEDTFVGEEGIFSWEEDSLLLWEEDSKQL